MANMSRPSLKKAKSATERRVVHLVTRTGKWRNKIIGELAPAYAGRRVLEIGSGRQDLGENAYSMKDLFPPTCEFIQSDVNPDFGHRVVDMITMEDKDEYDAILCLSVLEHVPHFWEAIPRLHDALRPGGRLFVSVPTVFPYHDEPHDYYRFTEYGVRLLLSDFEQLDVRVNGPRRLPFTILAIATK
jgi:SAM-dependent methyltransferase